MLADSEAELHAMADRIGVARRWYQGDHYNVCQAKRVLAFKLGAVSITIRQLGQWRIEKRRRGLWPFAPKDMGDGASRKQEAASVRPENR